MPVNRNVVYFGASQNPITQLKPATGSLIYSSQNDNASFQDKETYKEITQEMYKQNLELATRNKTLSVLRKLYAITISTNSVKEVSQRIVDTISAELNFSVVLIDLINNKANLLQTIAITKSKEITAAFALLGKTMAEVSIGMDNLQNLSINAIRDKERKITGNLLDILTPFVSQEKADQIEKITHIKTIVIYPLIFGGKTLGALTIGLAKKVDDLSRAERETLEQVIDVVSIIVDRAQLHEDLQSTNEQLKTANEKLQELDKLKDEFVSLASHELRTPMTAIKGSLSTILEGYAGDITKDSREFLTAAYNENDRLIRLVNNLLNISRIEAGRFTFTVTKIDMGDIINEIIHNLENAATERKIFLKYEADGNIPQVLGDIDKVKEVVINLVGNALKFTHKGGVTIRAKVKDKMVVTTVTDTGSGIAIEDQELLFKKFSQVGKNYARPAGGTGLGLYICKQIVEGLKGNIWLESIIGKGSTFFFSLPIAS